MGKNFRRVISIVFTVLLLLSLLAGCVDAGDRQQPATTSGESANVDTDDGGLRPNLPEKADYNRYDFRVLARGLGKWAAQDMYSEGENGNTINNAVFRRNVKVEDMFNFRISQTLVAKDAELMSQIMNSLVAGDDDFDLVWVDSVNIVSLAMQGMLYDFADLPYVNLEMPWWNKNAVDNLSINGHTYYTTGDISIIANQATYVITFNKTLRTNLDLPDPYALVSSGKWTMDIFAETANQAYFDVDADGISNAADVFGFLTYDRDVMGFMYAAGGRIADVSGGQITTNYYNENIDSMINKLMDLKNTKATFLFSSDTTADRIFTEGRTLYSFRTLINLASYRDMDTNYGILPMPKLNEAQTSYHSGVHAYGVSFIGIPYNCTDPDRTGAILEALAYESVDTLTPAYYDGLLIGRYFQDNESEKMLDIIFDTQVFDLGYFCDWADITSATQKMSKANQNMMLTLYNSKRKMIDKAIEDTIEAFNKK